LRLFGDQFLHSFQFYRRWVGGDWYLVIPKWSHWVVWVTDPYVDEPVVEIESYE